MYPKKFEDLIQAYSKLPGVGRKTAERYAFTTLNWDEEWINEFITSYLLLKMVLNVAKCVAIYQMEINVNFV